MGNLVTATNMCMCNFGVAPMPLPPPPPAAMVKGMAMDAYTAMDLPNGVIFGMCNSPMVLAQSMGMPQPCAPAFVPPWTPGCPTVMIGGKPALNNTSKLTCAKGMPMCIGIVMGCATVQVP